MGIHVTQLLGVFKVSIKLSVAFSVSAYPAFFIIRIFNLRVAGMANPFSQDCGLLAGQLYEFHYFNVNHEAIALNLNLGGCQRDFALE